MPKKPKRKIMRSFKLDEISGVDKPAQEGAVVTIMKRKETGLSIADQIVESYLKNRTFAAPAHAKLAKNLNEEDAQGSWTAFAALETSLHSIVSDNSLSDVAKVKMMRTSAGEFMKFTTQRLPDIEADLAKVLAGGEAASDEGDMNLRDLQKQMRGLNAKLDQAIAAAIKGQVDKRQDADDDRDGDILTTKRRRIINKEANEEDAAAQRLRSLLSTKQVGSDYTMDPVMEDETEKAGEEEEFPVDAFMGEEEDETEKADSDEQEPGTATTEGEEEEPIAGGSASPIGGKRHTVKRVRLGKDVIEVEGVAVHKAKVGPGLFAVLKQQQDRLNEVEKQANTERARRELLEFSKVAEDELRHLPGTVDQKARLLKRLSTTLDDEQRQMITKMFRAGDRATAAAFRTVGHNGLQKASGDFNKRLADIRQRDDCSRTEAMRKARLEFPEEFANYQGN